MLAVIRDQALMRIGFGGYIYFFNYNGSNLFEIQVRSPYAMCTCAAWKNSCSVLLKDSSVLIYQNAKTYLSRTEGEKRLFWNLQPFYGSEATSQ